MNYLNKVDRILSVGISLHDSGINNWALSKEQCLKAIEELQVAGIAIAGGNVLHKIDDEIGFSGASWHSDKTKDESNAEFIKRSILESKEYVIKFPATNDIYFSIVPW